YRVGPGILGAAAAEDATREIERDVAMASLEPLRERTGGADGWRRQRAAGTKHRRSAKALRRDARFRGIRDGDHPGAQRVHDDAQHLSDPCTSSRARSSC